MTAVRRLALLLLAGVAACLIAPPDEAPAPVRQDPTIRIGVRVDVQRTAVASRGTVWLSDPDEGVLEEIRDAADLDVTTRNGMIVVRGVPSGTLQRRVLTIEPVDSSGVVTVDGRDYRGRVELRRGANGILVVNAIGLEEYLRGVVAAEMGKRTPGDEAALKAQAVVARTYALRNQGRYQDRGYDLAADVGDQVYSGRALENPMATAAVDATWGEVLTFDGQPIDAFFSSTCGGRTEDGVSAFQGADRPYLRSIDDTDPSTGIAWCAISPRITWSETWSGAEFENTLRRTLPVNGLPGARAGDLREIRVAQRTRTDRILSIDLVGRGGTTTVTGQAVRRVLSPPGGGWLRSTDFTVRLSRSGSRIERVEIEGRGYGHGVGLCQFGAIGRSRAGQSYETILTSYFPGTELRRIY